MIILVPRELIMDNEQWTTMEAISGSEHLQNCPLYIFNCPFPCRIFIDRKPQYGVQREAETIRYYSAFRRVIPEFGGSTNVLRSRSPRPTPWGELLTVNN